MTKPTTPLGRRELQTLADSLRMLGNACELIAKSMGDDRIPVENFMSVVEALEHIQGFVNSIPVTDAPVAVDSQVEELAKDAIRLAKKNSSRPDPSAGPNGKSS